MFILRDILEKKKLNFIKIVKKIISDYKLSNEDLRTNITLLIEFLRSLIIIDANSTDINEQQQHQQLIAQRTIILTSEQFASILLWFKEQSTNKTVSKDSENEGVKTVATPTEEQADEIKEEIKSVEKHFLKELHEYLLEKLETTITATPTSSTNNGDECQHNDNLVLTEGLKVIFETLDKCKVNDDNEIINNDNLQMVEPYLPQAEGIVTQYASREIYKKCDGINERLSTNYWLNAPLYNDVEDVEMEQIPCDLTEVIKTCLPGDVNITSDCKRLLHLSASPQSNRERTTAAPCFRTRRVEVEPSTGRPEKKIFSKF